MTTADPRLAEFEKLLRVIDRLREPGGCPWDRDQTLESMTPSLLEETHEAIAAVQSGRRGDAAEELGDLLMNVLLMCRIAQDAGDFSLADVSRAIAAKLVRRHPHVFAGGQARTVDAVLEKWEAIKKEERSGAEDRSALAGIPAALPALLKAQRIGEKAARTGFRWKTTDEALAKLDEELGELRRTLVPGAPRDPRAIEEELGDVLFCVVNVARHAGVDAETALSRAAARFGARFRRLEHVLGDKLRDADPSRLEAEWRASKRALADRAANVPADAPEEWRAAAMKLERTHSRIVALVRDLPDDLCARRPEPPVADWSIDQVIEHLTLVAEAVSRGLGARLAAASGLPPFPPEGLAAHPPLRRMYMPTERVAAPPVVAPTGKAGRTALLPRLCAGVAALFALLPRAVTVNPRTVRLPHPVLGDLDLLQWFEFIAIHDERHATQIERIRRSFATG